jgi:hypothetical protein
MVQHWSCGGTKLKVVDKYKHLDIWFTYNLNRTDHINVRLTKVDDKTANLHNLFINKKVLGRVKTLVWFSYVRSTLEYGGEVWKADPQDLEKLKQVQTRAGIKIFVNSVGASVTMSR